MKSSVSRAVVAASVTVALGLTAACGSDNGSDSSGSGAGSDGKKSSGQPAQQKPAEKKSAALSAADLEKAVLAKGDLKGYKVEKMSAADMPSQTVPADPAACQPFADMFMFATQPTAKARVGRTMTGPDEMDATVISLALLAHEQTDAEKVMDDLRTATKKCTAYEHADSKYRDVAALPAPKAGDDAVSYKVVGLIEGQKTPMSFTVVRSGSTLAAFYSINLLKPKKFGVPAEIVEAQVKKVREA
ncbi:hypothetical protein [Streptomyces sp. Je 1-369]|uniref:hypothetical protein n=1 Tax=Streptomyces sp. Je 1-369 TaxID=2966192 RepID=UPI002285565D|nr:hypothetical protein [Streptomyces sp. Je 1-369]WAL97385.1 hypothetical protein NOO62_24555 [Streptomyces sp. Je 1-369]